MRYNKHMEKFSKKPEFIKKMFDTISKDYDKLNDIMSFGLHRRIKKEAFSSSPLTEQREPLSTEVSDPVGAAERVREGNFSPRGTSGGKMGEGYKILDLCTGTGDITAISKEKYPQSKIIGIDFSPNMLEIARKKHSDIEFLQGDCTRLPFEDESFDVCTMAFGLRNVEDLEKAVSEIHRVLKKDGIFINLDLGKPNKFFNLFLKPYMYVWVAILGKIFHGDETPYKYLAESNETFPAPVELLEIYKKIGFKKSENKNYLFGQIASQFSIK